MIYDADTGETIDNVFRAEIILDANQLNKVTLSYYPSDQNGIVTNKVTNQVEAETITVDNPEVDVTATEVK